MLRLVTELPVIEDLGIAIKMGGLGVPALHFSKLSDPPPPMTLNKI